MGEPLGRFRAMPQARIFLPKPGQRASALLSAESQFQILYSALVARRIERKCALTDSAITKNLGNPPLRNINCGYTSALFSLAIAADFVDSVVRIAELASATCKRECSCDRDHVSTAIPTGARCGAFQ